MSRVFICSECGGKLELGVIVDKTYGSSDASYWMEGTNEDRSPWTGLREKGKQKHYISALRCTQYGLLKFYAGLDNSETNK